LPILASIICDLPVIRITCKALRSAFDDSNERLVLGGGNHWQDLPALGSTPLAWSKDMMSRTPRLSSLRIQPWFLNQQLPRPLSLLQLSVPWQSLKRIDLKGFGEGNNLDLSPLATCSGLIHLDLHNTAAPSASLSLLQGLSKLQHLDLGGEDDFSRDYTDLAFLDASFSSSLQHLAIGNWCPHLQSIEGLSRCSALVYLRLQSCNELTSLAPLEGLTRLKELSLWYCRNLADIQPLASCLSLVILNLRHASVSDLRPLASCSRLSSLDLRFCNKLVDVTPLAACSSLQTLDLQDCDGVQDITPLSQMRSLCKLDLSHCGNIHDLVPLMASLSLRSLCMKGIDSNHTQGVEAIKAWGQLTILNV
jgi:Leucine-rich repeat (LRR) protein